MSHNITVEGGTSVRLPTAGKYCDRDIIITATGSAAGPEDLSAVLTEQEALIAALQDTLKGKTAGGGESPTALLDATLNNTLTAIDSNVTSVVGYACRGLSKLKTVNLPNATSIGTYAFYYCTALSSFSAPRVTALNTYVFYNCGKISSINFPLATSVPTQCFYSCGVLEKADFGAAKSIAANAFPYCEELVTLILRRSDAICTLANKNAFTDTPIEDGTGYVYVPAALVETYKTASNWSNFASQFRAIENYPEITGG
jgi:hypothetical protein